MKNKIKEKILWIVIFYNAESEKDWETVIASTFDMAIKTAKEKLRELCGLEKGEKLECTDFDAYTIEEECDLSGKLYQINLEIKKEK